MPSSIPTLNLSHRAKIGNTLNKMQIAAITAFYKHIKEHLPSAETDIYQEILNLISTLKLEPNKLTTTQPLTKQQRLNLSILYRQILAIYEENNTDIMVPDTEQTKIAKACRQLLIAFDTSSPEFLHYNQQLERQQQHATRLNAKVDQELHRLKTKDNHYLKVLLLSAINNDENPELTTEQINCIKTALGDKQFNLLTTRYNLNPNKLTMDDLRMLLIGTISTANNEILTSSFFQHLCLVLAIPQDSEIAKAQLTSNISKLLLNNPAQNSMLQRIQATSPTKLLDNVINWARQYIPEKWRFLISERFKINANLEQDLRTINLISKVTNWQRQTPVSQDKEQVRQQKIQQTAASYEYLFHGLAYRNLVDGTIVPVVEANGEIQYYQAHTLFNANGLVTMALIPTNTQNSPLDLKVLFRGTHNIGSAILDTEQYSAGYKSYRENEKTILAKLNSLIGATKKQAKATTGTTPTISLTVGGHSLGGGLTQAFYASLIKCNTMPIYRQLYEQYHGDIPALEHALLPIITKQLKYELASKHLSDHFQQADKLQELAKQRLAYLLKTLAKYPSSTEDDQHLATLTGINVGILNSAGIASKIRDVAADSLALLQSKRLSKKKPKKLTLNFTNILVGGDIVQQTGQTTVSSGLPAAHINVATMKIDANLEGKAKKQVLLVAACTVMQYLVTFTLGLKIPPIPWLPSFNDIKNTIIKAHCELHFDHPHKMPKYQLLTNNTPEHAIAQNKELINKIFIVKSKYFQTAKHYVSTWLKQIYNKFTVARNALINTVDAIERKIPANKFILAILQEYAKNLQRNRQPSPATNPSHQQAPKPQNS